MTSAIQHLLESFERLSTSERREAAREILRRSMEQPYGALSDEALAEIAESSFVELDRRDGRAGHHDAFLNGYAAEDEGLYDDNPTE